MKEALEALSANDVRLIEHGIDLLRSLGWPAEAAAIEALRGAGGVQPVAWRFRLKGADCPWVTTDKKSFLEKATDFYEIEPLYAAPSPASGEGVTRAETPIDMVLHCPRCGLQHIDAPEESDVFRATVMQAAGVSESEPRAWTNPPHKSHLCHRCGHVWRPADVPTNGVLETKTKGSNDSFTSMLGTARTAAQFDEFFDREYPDVEDRQGRFRNSNGYQLCWRGWEAATERAVAILRGVNNHDNPMTAGDAADEIAKGLEP